MRLRDKTPKDLLKMTPLIVNKQRRAKLRKTFSVLLLIARRADTQLTQPTQLTQRNLIRQLGTDG